MPRKYFWDAMFVAFCDQDFGTSTPFCSKATSPVRKFWIMASRSSHSISSYGWTPSLVKWRRIFRSASPTVEPAVVRVSCGTSYSPFLGGRLEPASLINSPMPVPAYHQI